MFSSKLSKFFLSPVTNIIIAFFLLWAFLIATKSIMQTITVAEISALANLAPQPMDYFWELNTNHAELDRNKIRYYADYYEQLHKVFPSLWEVNGILGYCYHYLNDDSKAVQYLTAAIQYNPGFFWNYYNLAVIYTHESRYNEAADILQKGLKENPVFTLRELLVGSKTVYLPLLGPDLREVYVDVSDHLKKTYQMGFVLIRLLNQAQGSEEIQEKLREIDLSLYAF